MASIDPKKPAIKTRLRRSTILPRFVDFSKSGKDLQSL
ncbi:MAG: ribosomal protein S19 family protein [Rickettsiales bacterium]|nr:ribosomal protein S19 family protein [Rickettsiales bacterium]